MFCMRILGVKVVDRTPTGDGGRQRATLLFQTDTGGISLSATAEGADTLPESDVVDQLVRDGLRQLNRLPEHRHGDAPVILAQDIKVEVI